MNEKTFKILSIDGGGIKGLYSATILKHLESRFKCQIVDYFDLICGTSTGGLIALGLSLKIPATKLVKFYEENGPKIFPAQNNFISWWKQLFGAGKYSNYELRKALKDVFADKIIEESNCLLCIPSYSVTNAQPRVFKYDHKEGSYEIDNKALYRDIGLATSAAPTYLPMVTISYFENQQYIDGGVWANDPSMVGFLEAINHFVGKGKEYSKLSILSISSLSSLKGKVPGLKERRSFINWGAELFDTSMISQAYFSHYFMEQVKKINDIPINYFKIPSAEMPDEHSQIITMDNTSQQALDLIKNKGELMGIKYKKEIKVAEFFKELKTYKTKNYGKL